MAEGAVRLSSRLYPHAAHNRLERVCESIFFCVSKSRVVWREPAREVLRPVFAGRGVLCLVQSRVSCLLRIEIIVNL